MSKKKKPAIKNKPAKKGRPDKFKPEYVEEVYKLALLGATDKQMSDFFNVSEVTFNAWKKKYRDFLKSIKKGKEKADCVIAESLFERAKGQLIKKQAAFKVKRTGIDENGKRYSAEGIEIVELIDQVPSDTLAAIFWLKNRRPDLWRDKQEVEHSGTTTPFKIIIGD